MRYEVVIIGGGIVGLATALALRGRLGEKLLLVEAEPELAAHQTGHNSGVIHSGLYYKPGSLKAENCIAGREALYAFCQIHGIPYERCGKIVVATRQEELPALDMLEQRGRANGLAGIRRLNPEEIRQLEPHAAGLAGLHVPETGIVNFRKVAEKFAELIRRAGCRVSTETRVTSARVTPNETVLQTASGEIVCRFLINCGGLYSDRIARMCGLRPAVRIVPFRGEYYELTPEAEPLVRNLIYPVPDPRFPFLGVHFTRMIDGGVEAGPNAVLAASRHGYRLTNFSLRDMAEMAASPAVWKLAWHHSATGLGELYRSLSKAAFVRALRNLLPELTEQDVVRGGSGVRAQAVAGDGRLVDDFVIERHVRMIHILNAPSPGATASLAIGEKVAAMAAEQFQLP